MKKVINKWFWVWNREEEKKFLEDMASEGLLLETVRLGSYVFEETDEQDLVYEMDFRGMGGKIAEDEYLQIYQDAGWTLVSTLGGWYYFCQPRKEGIDLTLFNDNDSKSAVYKRLMLFLLLVGFPLYYQVIFIYPNMPAEKLEFPGFYFFFRIIGSLILLLHALALAKIYTMYRKLRRDISE